MRISYVGTTSPNNKNYPAFGVNSKYFDVGFLKSKGLRQKALDRAVSETDRILPGNEHNLIGYYNKISRNFTFILGFSSETTPAIKKELPIIGLNSTKIRQTMLRKAKEYKAIFEQRKPYIEKVLDVCKETGVDIKINLPTIPEGGLPIAQIRNLTTLLTPHRDDFTVLLTTMQDKQDKNLCKMIFAITSKDKRIAPFACDIDLENKNGIDDLKAYFNTYYANKAHQQAGGDTPEENARAIDELIKKILKKS